jgi:hypothetical protein
VSAYSIAQTSSARSDIRECLASLIAKGWMEKIPGAVDREALIKPKEW